MPYKNKKQYNEYMKNYMTPYRQRERQWLNEYKKQNGITDKRIKKKLAFKP